MPLDLFSAFQKLSQAIRHCGDAAGKQNRHIFRNQTDFFVKIFPFPLGKAR